MDTPGTLRVCERITRTIFEFFLGFAFLEVPIELHFCPIKDLDIFGKLF